MDVFLDHLILKPHPSTPPGLVGGVSCGVSWTSAGDWVFDFIVQAPPEALRLPEPAAPERADGLWQTTCFEMFLRRPGSEVYVEFNLSPSGRWAAYGFDGYRDHMHDLALVAPRILTTDPAQAEAELLRQMAALGLDPETARQMAPMQPRGAAPAVQFGLSATFQDPAFMVEGGAGGPWLASLSAVIETADGDKSYWALNHPSDKPDFHHRESFVLELP